MKPKIQPYTLDGLFLRFAPNALEAPSTQRADRLSQDVGAQAMTDREILIWIHQRLAKVHGESPMVDYMHKLRDVIGGMPADRKSSSNVVNMRSTEVLQEIERADGYIAKPQN